MHKTPQVGVPNQMNNRCDDEEQRNWRQKEVEQRIEAGMIGDRSAVLFPTWRPSQEKKIDDSAQVGELGGSLIIIAPMWSRLQR